MPGILLKLNSIYSKVIHCFNNSFGNPLLQTYFQVFHIKQKKNKPVASDKNALVWLQSKSCKLTRYLLIHEAITKPV